MKKEDGAGRLEKLLSYWEDMCFIRSIEHRLRGFPLSGPLAHASEFRKYILEYKDYFDSVKYVGLNGAELLGTNCYIPMSILAWNHHSRRIFHLPSDMQTIFDGTSLGGMRWKDVRFPFDSFLVTLEDPLYCKELQAEYDCILLSKIDQFLHTKNQEAILEIKLIPKGLANYTKIAKAEKKRIDSFLHNQQYAEVHSFIKTFPCFDSPIRTVHLFTDMLESKTIKKSFSRLGELTGQPDMHENPVIDSALHIVINLCLYLENFPANTKIKQGNGNQTRPRTKAKRLSDLSAITNPADIFAVTCKFKMTQEELDKIVQEMKSEKAGHEKGAHWRRAHWRRKPYCGKIPWEKAPKDWILKKLIGQKFLPPNSLPKGSQAIIE